MNRSISHWRFALRWTGTHVLLSLALAALAASLVFGLWYPDPWRQMLGVGSIFAIVITVDVVCGPLLTLILANPKKSRRELWLDMSVVALIQLSALGYGLWAVFSARPVVMAFELDRWVVVTANEIDVKQLSNAPPGLQSFPIAGLHHVAVREARSHEEQLQSIEYSVQGLTPAMRPGWWIPVAEAKTAIDLRTRPLSELIARRPLESAVIEAAVDRTQLPITRLRYLPLTTSKTLDWIVLMNEVGGIVGYVQVDGFD